MKKDVKKIICPSCKRELKSYVGFKCHLTGTTLWNSPKHIELRAKYTHIKRINDDSPLYDSSPL